MPLFFIPKEQISGESLVILGSDAHHLKNVRRIRIGDTLLVSDGESNLYRVKINEVSSTIVRAAILERSRAAGEPPLELMLVQAIPKSPKMELIVQKCVEIGVSTFLPALSERSIPRLTQEKKNRLAERWQNIAAEAAKQCGRGKVPKVLPITDWPGALARVKGVELIVLPWEGEKKKKIREVLTKNKNIEEAAVLIGPEGGLTQQECLAARKAGAVTVTLGPRILRTETAGLVASTILMYESGCLE